MERTLRGLCQNFECCEKHCEFCIENNHEILEKLDYIGGEEGVRFRQEISKINASLREIYDIILGTKKTIRLLQEINFDENSLANFLVSLKEKLSQCRKVLRISRKVYQEIKEFALQKCVEDVLNKNEGFKETISKSIINADLKSIFSSLYNDFYDALVAEVSDGRANIYAMERHITEIILDIEERIKQLARTRAKDTQEKVIKE